MLQLTMPRSRGMLATALVLATASAGCADVTTQPARPLAGCYRLETNVAPGTMAELDALPDSVRLLDARGVRSLESGRALLRAHPDSLRTAYEFSWWDIAPPDTLALVFSTGFSGARLALRPSGDGYMGTIAAFSDALPPPPLASRAWLVPIACVD